MEKFSWYFSIIFYDIVFINSAFSCKCVANFSLSLGVFQRSLKINIGNQEDIGPRHNSECLAFHVQKLEIFLSETVSRVFYVFSCCDLLQITSR